MLLTGRHPRVYALGITDPWVSYREQMKAGVVFMADVLLDARHISRSFGRRPILRDVSFAIGPGTLTGIVGENGAGKSTLLRILAGELRPSAGEVRLHGALGYCPQTVVLNDALTVEQHLRYFRAAYNIASLDRAYALVERLDFAKYRNTLTGALSGGTRQKLNLTLALMHDPTVLLLDEPYQGFDWETYLRFWDLTGELRERGCALLVISHLIFDQHRFDQILALEHGELHPTAAAEAAPAR